MELDEMKRKLLKDGIFLYRTDYYYELAKKTGNKSYEKITTVVDYSTLDGRKYKLSAKKLLLRRINNQILDGYVERLEDIIPVIDFDNFYHYDRRNREIKKHKEILRKIQGVDFLAVEKQFSTKYYMIKNNNITLISESLVDGEVIFVDNIREIKEALNESFENEYTERYNREVEKWESLCND